MSKLLTSIAVGAAAGIAVGAIAHVAAERQAAGNPIIPSSLRAAVTALAPLGAGLFSEIASILNEGEGQKAPKQPLETATTPVAPGGHPAGPGFAQTPE